MKLHKSTKKQNRQWAFWYGVSATVLLLYGAKSDQGLYVVMGGILLGLALYRVVWLDKRL